ncbi:Protein priB [Vanrija pseudolonga]|uniref:Protein priB n=1 Tax=Vanrija pseudolonga TaxID=143232 RepID=A0AAF1BJL8_9TREE|nr:Protein priB [Vanrija pseudolonga]
MDPHPQQCTLSHSSTIMAGGRARRSASGEASVPDEPESNKRACDFCHQMKIKCVGKDNPPCKRCRSLGEECTFDRRRAAVPTRTDKERLLALENQMGSFGAALQGLTALIAENTAQLKVMSAGQTPSIVSNPSTLAQWVQAVPPVAAAPSPEVTSAPSMFPPRGIPPVSFSIYANPQAQVSALRAVHGGSSETWSGRASNTGDEDDDGEEGEEYAEVDAQVHDITPSDDEDGEIGGRRPLATALGPFLQSEETARLRSDGVNVGGAAKRPHDGVDGGDRQSRRARVDSCTCTANHSIGAEPADDDPVTLGLVGEEEGRRLFDLFHAGASDYVPIFDPATDTFDEIRRRSPLCLTTIMMIGQMCADAEVGGKSELGVKLKRHAEKIAASTLFSPIASMSIVQGLILLATWGDTAWRPVNHANAVAVDMGLYRCLPNLIATGMGAGRTPDELEADRRCVMGARLWLVLTRFKLAMSMNHGRPVVNPDEDGTISTARRLLEHPLSIPTDSRCIALVELVLHRQMGLQMLLTPEYVSPPEVDEIVHKANEAFDGWGDFWADYYASRGTGADNFLVTELSVMKSHSILQFHYHVLRGVQTKLDVDCLPRRRRHWLVRSLHVADELVAHMVQPEALVRLRFADHYAFVGLAFAAKYLLRLARILPERVDLRGVVRNVTTLADQLNRFPGFSFHRQLRHVAARTRARHRLPESGLPSPHATTTELPVPAPLVLFPEAEALGTAADELAFAQFSENLEALNGNESEWLDLLVDGPFTPLLAQESPPQAVGVA